MASEIKRLTHLAQGKLDCPKIDPRLIHIREGWNPRNYALPENRLHLDNLKKLITAVDEDGVPAGVQKPLEVQWDVVDGSPVKVPILIDGECRLRAVLELIDEGCEIKTVPVMQVPGAAPANMLLRALTANSGKSLSKWELGVAYKRLANFGWPSSLIANRNAVSEKFVKEAIELTDAPAEIKQMLSTLAVTPAAALNEIHRHGSNASFILRAKIEEARAKSKRTGKAAPVKRKKKTAGKKVSKSNPLYVAALALVASVTEADLDGDNDWVAVNRKCFTKLAEAVNVPF
jgi:ParB-like chromosome segregation protein Spo0J